jgi:hypothetical protein
MKAQKIGKASSPLSSLPACHYLALQQKKKKGKNEK